MQEVINNRASTSNDIIKLIVELQSITGMNENFLKALSSINTTEGKGVLQVLIEKPERNLDSLKASCGYDPIIVDVLKEVIKNRLQEVIGNKTSTAEDIIKLVVELKYITKTDADFLETLSSINTPEGKGVLRVIIEKPERNLAKFKAMCDTFPPIRQKLYQKAYDEFSKDAAPTRASIELGQLIYELAKANFPASDERFEAEKAKASALGYNHSNWSHGNSGPSMEPLGFFPPSRDRTETMRAEVKSRRDGPGDNDSPPSRTPTSRS